MNNKLREQLVKEAEEILYGYDVHYANEVMAFAEGVLGFLKAIAPEDTDRFNYDGMGY